MKERIDYVLDNYLLDSSIKVDSSREYFKKFVKEIPEILTSYFDPLTYKVKASCGNGQKSEIPWICIFNRKVTTTATQGIFICYLIKADMSGFYLVLGQGATAFEKYKNMKYENIKKVACYFQELIDDDSFGKSDIKLDGKNARSKGYEEGTIISKYYEKGNYTEEELLSDLNTMKKIYDDICLNLVDQTYMDIVENVISSITPMYILAQNANRMIEEVLLRESGRQESELITLELTDIPKPKRKNKYSSITTKIVKKLDHLERSKSNADNGLIGEQLVLQYEQDRLISLGREDLAGKIRWIGNVDDTKGYDIVSYDVDEDGNEKEIYIEVKSTEGKEDNIFFISRNELEVMKELKDNYFLYRVYAVKSNKPKVFIIDYKDFNNKFDITPESYKVNLTN